MIPTDQSLPPNPAVVLITERLMLRPLCRDDIPALLPLIGAREVAATTLRIAHPYTLDDAENFLKYTEGVWAERRGRSFRHFLA